MPESPPTRQPFSTAPMIQGTGRIDFPRQALHAETLTLVHPGSGERMTWVAPLPKDMRQLEGLLRAKRV